MGCRQQRRHDRRQGQRHHNGQAQRGGNRPTSTPSKTGHAFKGWYTSASGGSLYKTVTITASKTFYAQYTANSYTLTWDLGDGNTETTKQTYGEKLVLPAEPTRKGAEFLGWFTEPDGGTQVTANDVFAETADKTYYAHWEITEVFSVTVPVTLPLVVDESGEVHNGRQRSSMVPPARLLCPPSASARKWLAARAV